MLLISITVPKESCLVRRDGGQPTNRLAVGTAKGEHEEQKDKTVKVSVDVLRAFSTAGVSGVDCTGLSLQAGLLIVSQPVS